MTDGDWHHVAGTYDGSDFKLYLNGTVDAEVSPATKPDNHDNFLFIGGCDIGNYWMTGTIDEVVLYDRALSEKELNELIEDVDGSYVRRETGWKTGDNMESA